MKQSYENETSQAGRKAVLRNDRSTYLDHYADDAGGRFLKRSPVTIVGSTAGPVYPAAAPWSQDQTGQEPVLGIDVNALEPVGEPFEIARSLADEPTMAPTASSPVVRDCVGSSAPLRRRG